MFASKAHNCNYLHIIGNYLNIIGNYHYLISMYFDAWFQWLTSVESENYELSCQPSHDSVLEIWRFGKRVSGGEQGPSANVRASLADSVVAFLT